MKLGIIGAGNIGASWAELFTRAGHDVAISNSSGPETLKNFVERLGPKTRAVTPEEAARFGEVVLEAIPFGRYQELPAQALNGKIVVTAANYFRERDGDIDFSGLSQSELIARHLAGARVVKAFNTIYFMHLREQGDTKRPLEDRRAIFLAGDDADAKAVVSQLIEEIGFAPVDTGSLRDGGRLQEPGSALNKNLTAREARALLQRS